MERIRIRGATTKLLKKTHSFAQTRTTKTKRIEMEKKKIIREKKEEKKLRRRRRRRAKRKKEKSENERSLCYADCKIPCFVVCTLEPERVSVSDLKLSFKTYHRLSCAVDAQRNSFKLFSSSFCQFFFYDLPLLLLLLPCAV